MFPAERYERIQERLSWLTGQRVVFGLHVHVGVPGGDTAMGIIGMLVQYLPHLVAASANSPFWQGVDTGLASTRVALIRSMVIAAQRLLEEKPLLRRGDMRRRWIAIENKWLATRYGLEALYIRTPSGKRAPLLQDLTDLVSRLTPIARESGDYRSHPERKRQAGFILFCCIASRRSQALQSTILEEMGQHGDNSSCPSKVQRQAAQVPG